MIYLDPQKGYKMTQGEKRAYSPVFRFNSTSLFCVKIVPTPRIALIPLTPRGYKYYHHIIQSVSLIYSFYFSSSIN